MIFSGGFPQLGVVYSHKIADLYAVEYLRESFVHLEVLYLCSSASPVLCTMSTLISWDSQFKEPIGVPSLYHILESLSRLWTQVIVGFTLFVSHFVETDVLPFLMSNVMKNSICQTFLLF